MYIYIHIQYFCFLIFIASIEQRFRDTFGNGNRPFHLRILGHAKGNLLSKIAAAFKSRKNACRSIRRLITATPGVTLKIPIDVCEVHVKLRKPIRVLKAWWPMIRLDQWAKFLLREKPELLLGGNSTKGNWRKTFTEFWDNYKKVDSQHPIHSESFDLGGCIPYYIHGDEGRGQLRRPYMVISWQCMISHQGPQVVNDTSFLPWIWHIFLCKDWPGELKK